MADKVVVPEEQLKDQVCPKCGFSWFIPLDLMKLKEDRLAPPPKGKIRLAGSMGMECAKCHAFLLHNADGQLEEIK